MRTFVLLSGGPGLYDAKDPEHDASWANYVTGPLILTKTEEQRRAFTASEEKIAWVVYRPAYESRWSDDVGRPDRKDEVDRVKGLTCDQRKCTSYVDLLEWRAKERSWPLTWIADAAGFWTALRAMSSPISRIWYSGHARDSLWLTLQHDRQHVAIAPSAEAIINVDSIDANADLKSAFQDQGAAQPSIFYGCNTHTFAQRWAKVFGVHAVGFEGKITFSDITQSGYPAPSSGCVKRTYGPLGTELSAEAWTEGDVLAVARWRASMRRGEEAPSRGAALGLWSGLSPAMRQSISEDLGLGDAPAPSAGAVFDAFTAPSRRAVGRRLERYLEVIARPGESITGQLQSGDVLLRRSYGEAPSAHHFTLASGAIFGPAEVLARGGRPESQRPGGYVEVLQCPNARPAGTARRLVDQEGHLERGQIVVRWRGGASRAWPWAEAVVETAPQVAVVLRNRLNRHDPVTDCTVSIVTGGTTVVTGRVNRYGQVALNLSAVVDGTYSLVIVPDSSTPDPVGPAIASATPRPRRIWRTLTTSITVTGGAITATGSSEVTVSRGELTARVQPVWMDIASVSSSKTAARSLAVSAIMVHHTGGTSASSAINEWLGNNPKSTHYLVDTDGQIVKLVHEALIANHAGASHWRGQDGLNGFSVGIELVHASGGTYQPAQCTELVGLLGRIRAAYATIPADGVVGHSDTATTGTPRRLGRKATDPGIEFDWPTLEAAGLGLTFLRAAPAATAMYGSFYALVPGGALRNGDNDAGHRYGGAARTSIAAAVIRELQEDLVAIGYYAVVDGTFSDVTEWAVKMFQDHFFAGTRSALGPAHRGRVDQTTAEMIKRVRP